MEDPAVRAPKACIRCRRQKMKCIVERGNNCRRCARAGLACVFVPRANASIANSSPIEGLPEDLGLDLLQRVKAIEDHLGISSHAGLGHEGIELLHVDQLGEDRRLDALWRAAASLERCSTGQIDRTPWQHSMISHLFQTFHKNMPGLHFLPDKQKYSTPQPILLAAMLYCSSARGEPNAAQLAPQYLTVLCIAISQLTNPMSEIGNPPSDLYLVEEWAFQTVLGLVLAGLLAEGSILQTGIWISMAYRLMLEHCPPYSDEQRHDWRKLFNGVQIVDLEHASLHLLSPVIPIEPPIASLRTSQRDQLYRLSRMMHTGLAHFAGRGLPTIWSCFSDTAPASPAISTQHPFTAVDGAVMRDWARQLDDWLEEFMQAYQEPGEQRRTVFRQYVLHRLLVLSIYHPARGCDLRSSSMTPKEQHELLLSARATVKLHIDDKTIWSNWDLVMITWAALIVISGVEAGAGDVDDLKNVESHLASLKDTNETGPSLRARLATRLEGALRDVRIPDAGLRLQQPAALEANSTSPGFDPSWEIFNQASLEQVLYSAWPAPSECQTPPRDSFDARNSSQGVTEPARIW